MSENRLLKNYNFTIYEITMQASLYSEYSKLLKLQSPDHLLGPKRSSKLNTEKKVGKMFINFLKTSICETSIQA